MYYLGIDLGATNMRAAIVDETGRIIRQNSMPTHAGRNVFEIIQDMAELSLRLFEVEGIAQSDITAAGIGVPGLADLKTGFVHQCSNLFWKDVPLADILRTWFVMPVYITNDANCSVLAEACIGVFRGRKNAVLITLGSGVGGGILLDGKLYTGAHGAAGEIGHMVIHLDGDFCACGNRGCFERYASADALIRMAQRAVAGSPDSLILRKAALVTGAIDAQIVIDAAKEGDPIALRVFEEYIYNLSKGIVSLINLYDPEILALGGGVSCAGEFLISAVRSEVSKYLFFNGFSCEEIVLSALCNEAGVIGAALFAHACA